MTIKCRARTVRGDWVTFDHIDRGRDNTGLCTTEFVGEGFHVRSHTARMDGTKALCAALIQQMIDLRDNNPEATQAQKRGASIAITLIEGAQMAAVKANFAQA